MKLAERLNAFAEKNATKRGTPCGVCSLPQDALVAIRQMRAAGKPYSVISKALKSEKFNVNEWSIGNHFRIHEPAH